jgi:hypothetical protein
LKKLTVLFLAMLVVLSMCGSVYAKSVTSSAGGIGTTHTGAGYGSFEKSAGAGHSAFVSLEAIDTISGDGAHAKSTISDSDTDSDEFSTAYYKGTIQYDASVDGGDGVVTFNTWIKAEADENPVDPLNPIFWATSSIGSSVKASADAGVTAKGEVSSSGTAKATSVWELADGKKGSLSTASTGKTSASVELNNPDDDSLGSASAEIRGTSAVQAGGDVGSLSGTVQSRGEINKGSGKAISSASGTTIGTAEAQTPGLDAPLIFYQGFGIVDGTADGSVEVEHNDGIVASDYSSRIELLNPAQMGYASLSAMGNLYSEDPDYQASVDAQAKGSALYRETYSGSDRAYEATRFNSVSGSGSIRADQEGAGWISGDISGRLIAALGAFSFQLPLYVQYPHNVDVTEEIVDHGTWLDFNWMSNVEGSSTEIISWAILGSDDHGFEGSATAKASGKAVSTNTISDKVADFSGSFNSISDGSVRSDAGSKGVSYSRGEAVIRSLSSLSADLVGLEHSTFFTCEDNPLGPLFIDLELNTWAGTGELINAYSEAEGALTTASGSAKGSAFAGAEGVINNVDFPTADLIQDYGFKSSASAFGEASSEAKSRTDAAESESSSLIFGWNAVGRELTWIIPDTNNDLFGFVAGEHSLLTSSAVYSPGTSGKSTATGKVKGTAQSAGELVISTFWDNDDPDIVMDISSYNHGAGALASDISAKDGYGSSKAGITGGNFAGLDAATKQPIIQSLDYSWDEGIHTYVDGTAPTTGSIKSIASVKDGVSSETGHISLTEQDDFDPTEWNEVFALDTHSLISDISKSELTIKKGGTGIISTRLWAKNYATYDGSGAGGYYLDAMTGAQVSYLIPGPGVKEKAQIKPYNRLSQATISWNNPPDSGYDSDLSYWLNGEITVSP